MFNLRKLLPTTKEARRVFFGVCTGLLVAAVTAFVAFLIPAAREWIGRLVRDLFAFASRDVMIRGWVVVVLAIFGLLGVFQFFRWLVASSRSPNVRLFRSLTPDEQLVLRLLAQCDYGLTEGVLSSRVPVSAQRFLHFIDRLVDDLRLAERTEPAGGGAFWALSPKGREVAPANYLFHDELPKA